MKNPNAFAALVTTLLAATIVHFARKWGYAEFATEQAIGYAGGAVTVVLFLGKEVWTLGIKGIVSALWRGTTTTAKTVTVGNQNTTK